MAAPLPLETQTLFAELLEHLLGVHARRSLGSLKGAFTAKTIKGETYFYFQASQPGGLTKQFYIGRKKPVFDRMIRQFEREHADMAPGLDRVNRLAAQLRAGGVNITDSSSARVIRALAESGLFEASGVLVGTHAFAAIGNLLGVRWASGALRTQDVDVARAGERTIGVAISDAQVDVPSVLETLKMGFLPVPPLDPKHASTSFKVRGQSLRVDLLCPGRHGATDPIFIPRWNAAAQPLEYLDYILESPERAIVLNGGAALVNVPSPARFAFHKLLIARLRPAAFQTKADKDITQAAELLEFLAGDRPGDIELAWEALVQRGARWQKGARLGLAALARREVTLHARIVKMLGLRV